MKNAHLNNALEEVGKLLRDKLKLESQKDGFKATGELEKSFTYSNVAEELNVYGKRYAKALSEGISTGGSGSKAGFEQLQSNIIKWAKIKGIRPLTRDKKGRFKKVNEHSWRSLGYVLARSIRRKGISKRFSYKGSGFMQAVLDQTKIQVEQLILEGYKKDLQEQLDKIKK